MYAGDTRERLWDLLLDIPEGAVIPSASQLGRELGVSRERIRQLLNEFEEDGDSTLRHQMVCRECAEERLDTRKQGAIQRARQAGWAGNSHNGWLCPRCKNLRWYEKAAWPRPGSIYARLLEWMAAGKPYVAIDIARELGACQSHISRAKTALIAAGMWQWDVKPHHGKTPNPQAKYITEYHQNTPKRQAQRARWWDKFRRRSETQTA